MTSNAMIVAMHCAAYSLLFCVVFPSLSIAKENIAHPKIPSYTRLAVGQKELSVYEGNTMAWLNGELLVVNAGQTSIRVKIIQKFPGGQTRLHLNTTLDPAGNTLFTLTHMAVIEVLVWNLSPDRIGFVYVAPGQNFDIEGSSSVLTDAQAISALKKISIFGMTKIPYVGEPLGVMLDIFWSEESTNVWNEVENNVEKAINKAIAQLLRDLYNGKINGLKNKLTHLYREYNSSSNVAGHYMNIAEDMLSLQSELSSNSDFESKFYAMPYYSTATLMMVSFYTFGMNCDKTIGLNAEDVKRIANYRNEAIVEANRYLPKLFNDMLEYQYKNLTAQYGYQKFAEIRRLYSEYGSEYMKIWNHMQANDSKLIEFNEIHYSTNFLGSSDGKLNALMVQNPPLEIFTPKLLPSGERNKLDLIGIYWQTYDDVRYVSGFLWKFRGGEIYTAGVQTFDHNLVSLESHYVIKLVFKLNSKSRIVQTVFYLSDNQPSVEFGNSGGSVKEWTWDGNNKFVLASMFASFDQNSYGTDPPYKKSRFNNLAVSYQRHNFINIDDYVDMKCK